MGEKRLAGPLRVLQKASASPNLVELISIVGICVGACFSLLGHLGGQDKRAQDLIEIVTLRQKELQKVPVREQSLSNREFIHD